MDILLPLVYDLLAVILILITVSYSSMRGFAATFVGVLGHLSSFFGATFLSKSAAKILYAVVIKGEIMSFLRQKIVSSGEISVLLSQLQDTLSQLPELAGNILGMSGFDQNAISSALANTMNDSLQALEQAVIGPAVTGFLTMVLFAILFFLFTLLVRFITKAVKIVFRIPVLMPIDRFFGGAIGILSSAVNLYLICILVRLLLSFVGEMKYLNLDIIENTFLWSQVYHFDPMPFLN